MKCSQGCSYCFVFRLLSITESPFATSAFNNWKHSNVIVEHEISEEHRNCMIAYLIQHKKLEVLNLHYLNTIDQSRHIGIKC